MSDHRAQQVLDFWFDPALDAAQRNKRWFAKDAAFDAEIRRRFLPLYEEAAAGRLASWMDSPREALALVVLLDQFPRNMFRGDLACELIAPLGEELLRYAERHREIIQRFGRFPHRNAILGRASTLEETEFLKLPGSGF
jgi:uncharacterized protein (DUF924 family)